MARMARLPGPRRALTALVAPALLLGLMAPAAEAAPWTPVATLGLPQAGARAVASAPALDVQTVDLILRRDGPLPPAPGLGVRYSPSAAAARVGPTLAQYDALAAYLGGAGLTVSHRYADRLLLQVRGVPAALDRAFHVQLATYAGAAGASLVAPARAASLPATLAPIVAGIAGLSSDGWPTPAPLVKLPDLTAAAAPSPDAAGPVQDAMQADIAAASFLPSFKVSGPTTIAAGVEADYRVTLMGPSGAPLKGYVVRPVTSEAVSGYTGPTGPGSMVTNAKGQASFWLITGTQASFSMTVAAAPNPPPSSTPAPPTTAGPPPPPVEPTPVYATGASLPVQVTGPVASLKPYTAAQVNSAYDLTPLLAAGDNGHGVGVGIVIWNSFLLSDVQSYFQQMGETVPPKVTVIPVDGTPQSGDGGTEATLDVERVGGTAPGSHIYVYDAATAQGVFDALITALQDAKVSIISMSWGIPETDVPNGFFNPFETLFDAAAQEGITCIASSGDTGSRADGLHTGVNVPASSPFVLAVGGTDMAVDPATGQIAAQTAWSPDGSFSLGNISAPSASTGGYSRYYVRPTWQVAPGLGAFWSEPFRGVPDVALAATYPGYVTILDGKSQAYGGTSASAPTWAGFLADIESEIGAPLGSEVMPLLYTFANGAAPEVFTPVTQGNNIGFHAGPGWNPVTGLGTPDVARLAQAIVTALTPARLVVVRAQAPGTDRVGHSVSVAAAVLDAYGIPIGGVPVTATAPHGGNVTPGNATTGGHGTATFSLRASLAGYATYTFTVPAGLGPDGQGSALTAQFAMYWNPAR